MPNVKFINGSRLNSHARPSTRPFTPTPAYPSASASAHQSARPSASAYNEKLDDEKLYALCKKYGAQARFWRQKFIGLLPEVNRRRLYEKRGFASIFEFSAKLCGLSMKQVRLALNLERRFGDKPALRRMLENGEASINKLSRVVSIATPQNEEELAERIKILPKSALDTWVRDEKAAKTKVISEGALDILALGGGAATENQNGLPKPFFDAKSLPGQIPSTAGQTAQILNFKLAGDVTQELNELHSKGIDVNELLRAILRRREEEIIKAKEGIAETIKPAGSRHIPVKIRKILREEHGKKCSIATCRKPAKTIHHTQRFGLSQNHDPRFLAPLCRNHHIIAHSIDLKYRRAREFGTAYGNRTRISTVRG